MKKKSPLSVIYLVLILIFLYAPIFTLMVLSFNSGRSMGHWSGFSLHWYAELFEDETIMEALINTIVIALVSAASATLIGTLACLGIQKLGNKSRNILLALNNVSLLNADIVTGISLMLSFVFFGITLSMGTVILSHITFCLPYVILSVMPKLKQLGTTHYDAALDLGATPAYAFFKIQLPELMPGIASGFLLSFTLSVDDFIVTHFTRGAGVNTLSTMIYGMVKVGIRPTIYALSTIVFILVLILLLLANYLPSKKKSLDEKRHAEARL